MRLTVVLPLSNSRHLSAAAIHSIEQAAQLGVDSKHLLVLLVYSEEFLNELQLSQQHRLRAVEELVHSVFEGSSFCCSQSLAIISEIGKTYGDQPIVVIDPLFYIDFSSLHVLMEAVSDLGSLDSILVQVRKRKAVANSQRLDNIFYRNDKRLLRINPYAILSDLISDRYLIFWMPEALHRSLSSHGNLCSRLSSGPEALRWTVTCLLLDGRMRISCQQFAYCDLPLDDSLDSSEINRLRMKIIEGFAEQSKDRLYSLLGQVLFVAGSEVFAKKTGEDKRMLLTSEIHTDIHSAASKVLREYILTPRLFDSIPPNWAKHGTNLHSHYYEVAIEAVGHHINPSANDINSHPLGDSGDVEWHAHHQHDSSINLDGIPQLYQLHPQNLLLSSLSSNETDLALFCDSGDDEPTIHALVASHQVEAGSFYCFSCVAKSDSLRQLTLRLPAPVFGEEIRVNVDLAESNYYIASGRVESVRVVLQPDKLIKCELVAAAVSSGTANFSVRLCKNNTSYYQADGSGRLYLGQIGLSQIDEQSNRQPLNLSGFSCYNVSLVCASSFGLFRLSGAPSSNVSAQLISLKTSIVKDALYHISFTVSKREVANIELSILDAFSGNGNIVVDFDVSCARWLTPSSGVPYQVQCDPIDAEKVRCSVYFRSIREGIQDLVLSVVPPADSRLSSPDTNPLLKPFELGLSFKSRSIVAEPSQTSVSIIAVTYGMHNYVPEWLANYGLQSVHSSGMCELLVAEPELYLPLHLYLELFARLTGLKIHIIPMVTDPGLYECWNRLIRLSEAKYISNFNPDDRKLPEHIQALVSIAEESLADVCSSACYVSTEQHPERVPYLPEDIVALPEVWWESGPGDTSYYRIDYSSLYKRTSPNSVRPNNQIHSMPLWRRDLHARFGFFEESHYSTYADYALWIQALKQGAVAIFDPRPLYMFSVIESSHNRVNKNQAILDSLISACES